MKKKTSANAEVYSSEEEEDDRGGGGTMDVSRGALSSAQRKDRRKRRRELEATAGSLTSARDHLWGNQAEAARARQKLLKLDDKRAATKALTGLNVKQQLALQKRRGRPDKVVVAKLERQEFKQLEAAVMAAQAESLLQTGATGLIEAETDMERTTALTQTQLKREYLDAETARQVYDLDLTREGSTPYGMEYDRSGRYGILYGMSSGHLAVMDNHQQNVVTEFHVRERVRDACFLHNFTLFAVAQKNHAFIYDYQTGAEVHRLNDHGDPMALQFLPYHWLLASIGRAGYLKYTDTSTGQLVSQHRSGLGPCSVLRQNPINAVLHAGHANGTVTLWSPASSQYLVKMLCHKGAAVHSLAVDPTGHVMVTGGADRQIRVWDLRMYKERHAYYCSGNSIPASLDISQRGLLAVGHAGHATIWSANALHKKVKDPYMHHAMPRCGPVETIRFRPFEDVCGIGHARGITSIVVPGSGEPTLDTSEYNLNPMADAKQRREAEVRSLLDKLRPDMIGLDADEVGGIEESDPHSRLERIRDLQEEANAAKGQPMKKKKKKRGRSKIQTQLRRKHRNIVDQNTLKLREAREREKAGQLEDSRGGHENEGTLEGTPSALKRFF